MKNLAFVLAGLLVFSIAFPLYAGPLVGDGSGVFTVEAFSVAGGGGSNDNDLNSTNETRGIWAAIDGGATVPSPPVVSVGPTNYNVDTFHQGTAAVIDYAGGGGNFGVDNPYSSIDGSGTGLGGDDFSVRARAFLEFTVGGTYTIAGASDDGRTVILTAAQLEGGSPFTGFTTKGGQQTAAGAFETFFDGATGHNNTTGVFSVAAGDILALDSFMFERAGGDSFELSMTNVGNAAFTTGGANPFQLLTDGLFGIQIHTELNAVPEPGSIAIWSMIGLLVTGLGYFRYRRIKA